MQKKRANETNLDGMPAKTFRLFASPSRRWPSSWNESCTCPQERNSFTPIGALGFLAAVPLVQPLSRLCPRPFASLSAGSDGLNFVGTARNRSANPGSLRQGRLAFTIFFSASGRTKVRIPSNLSFSDPRSCWVNFSSPYSIS